jgi:hypothetical protein
VDFGVAGEVGDIEGEHLVDAVDDHGGDEAGVVDAFAGDAVLDDETQKVSCRL